MNQFGMRITRNGSGRQHHLLVANEIIVSTIKKASCLFPSNLIYCFPKYVSSANSVYSNIAYYLEIYTTIARHVIQ